MLLILTFPWLGRVVLGVQCNVLLEWVWEVFSFPPSKLLLWLKEIRTSILGQGALSLSQWGYKMGISNVFLAILVVFLDFRWDLRVFQKYLRCCWWTTELLHTSSKNGLEVFCLSVFSCKSWWEWGWCVRFLVDQFTAFSSCLWRFWCVCMLRCVIFFIGCEAYLHGILRAANIPHFDTRFYAPLFLFCVVWFNGSPSYM